MVWNLVVVTALTEVIEALNRGRTILHATVLREYAHSSVSYLNL